MGEALALMLLALAGSLLHSMAAALRRTPDEWPPRNVIATSEEIPF